MSFRISKYRDTSFNDIDGSGVFELSTTVYCDTEDDLPGEYDIQNHKLVLGCKAVIVKNGDVYYLSSDGQWNKDESGGGGGGSTLIEKTITANGTYNASSDDADGYKKVIVDVQPTSELMKDVNFFDSDGSILYAYTAEEFAQLDSFPANPTHSGLTSQGWNWSFSDAKTHVAKYGKLNLGQMYITDDGKTRLYIRLDSNRLEFYVGICIDGSVTVDWGDGSDSDVLTGSSLSTTVYKKHAYSSTGDYLITLDVTGSMSFNYPNSATHSKLLSKFSTDVSIYSDQDRIYLSAIKKIEIGSGITSLGEYALSYCSDLQSITIPNTITSFGGHVFQHCYGLKYCTIPSNVTDVGINTFSGCYTLKNVSLSNGLTTLGDYVFYNCYAFNTVTFPEGVTSIGIGTFYNCYEIMFLIIPSTVSTVGGNGLYDLCGISYIKFYTTTPPTFASSSTIEKLANDCTLYIPQGTLSLYQNAQYYPKTSSSSYKYIEF